MPGTARTPPFRIRSLGLSVYLPTLLFAIGQGAVIPFAPLHALDLGASVAFASLIVAFRGLGMMAFDIPAGMLVAVIGERYSMLVGAFLLVVVAVGTSLTSSPIVFAALMPVMGASWSIWQLARLTYVSEQAPPEMRGRALSMIGGANRIGNFAGPFAGSLAGRELGLASTFHVQAVLAVAASLLMFALIKGDRGDDRGPVPGRAAARERFAAIIARHRRVLATAGFAMICLGVLRSSRQTIIPLWGDAIGLSPALVGAVFGASNGLDMLLFYPIGAVMDRRGRKRVVVPCLLTLTAGLMLVPLATTTARFVVVAMITGLGNGMGSGIVMTLGADFSPPASRAEFLGVWRLLTDAGHVGGPLVIGALAGAVGLGLASTATGGFGLLGAVVVWLFVAETLPARKPATGPGG